MTRKVPASVKIIFLFLFIIISIFVLFSLSVVILKFPVSQEELSGFFLNNQVDKKTEVDGKLQINETSSTSSSFSNLALNPTNEEIESSYREYFTKKWKAKESFFSFKDSFLIYPDREPKKAHGLEVSGILAGFKDNTIYVNTELGTLPIWFSKDTSFIRLNPTCDDIESLCPQLLDSSDKPLFYSVSLEYFVSSYDNISRVKVLFSSLPVERKGYLTADMIIFLPKGETQ